MFRYDLTNKANEDLNSIWDYTFDEWSEEQADKYYFELLDCCQFLAENQDFGRNYKYIEKNLFGYVFNKPIIFYQKVSKNEILVARILHTSMDLKKRIRE